MTNPKLSNARRQSWITRKERYGASGMTAAGRHARARAAAHRRLVSCEASGKSNHINAPSPPTEIA